MSAAVSPARRATLAFAAKVVAVVAVAAVVAGCGTGAASPTPSDASSAVTPTPVPTATVAVTPALTPSPTAVPSPTPGPLCTGHEEVAAVAIWHTISEGTEIQFFTGTFTSTSGGRVCYMRGTAEVQIVAGGHVIADSGPSSAAVVDADPFFEVQPGARAYTSAVWGNWCGATPRQPITVAIVLPAGLGRVVANDGRGMTVPRCVAAGTPSTVTTTSAWHA